MNELEKITNQRDYNRRLSDHQQTVIDRLNAHITAQATRIEQLEADNAALIVARDMMGRKWVTARNDALREAAGWHMDVAKHDASGMEYSSLVGIPISNWSELDTSVKTHEFCAREILALITGEQP